MLHKIKQLFDFVHVQYDPFYKAPHTTGHHVIRIVNQTNLPSKKMYSSYKTTPSLQKRWPYEGATVFGFVFQPNKERINGSVIAWNAVIIKQHVCLPTDCCFIEFALKN